MDTVLLFKSFRICLRVDHGFELSWSAGTRVPRFNLSRVQMDGRTDGDEPAKSSHDFLSPCLRNKNERDPAPFCLFRSDCFIFHFWSRESDTNRWLGSLFYRPVSRGGASLLQQLHVHPAQALDTVDRSPSDYESVMIRAPD